MKTVLICNQKGGVGKTVIADELAFALERDKIKYSFFDLDDQGSACHETYDRPDASVAIVDTPGALQEDLISWVEQADFILVPTLMSAKDMGPLVRMIEILKPYMDKKPIAFVLNKWDRFNHTKDFIEWFETEYPDYKYFILSDSVAFYAAGSEHMSVCDINHHSAKTVAQQINAIYGAIKYELNIKESWRK